MRAIYPGSFDPPTLGHLNLIERAAAFSQELVVAVVQNPAKKNLFTPEQRCELLRELVAQNGLRNVEVTSFSGLLVNFVQAQGARVVIRGLRDAADTSGELQMARLNASMTDCETLFLAADSRWTHVSSSFVREIARLGGPVDHMVPPLVAQQLHVRLSSGEPS